LLGAADANAIRVKAQNLPRNLLRKLEICSLLDIAVGSGAVDVSKNLLEFHRARPTRETLKMALSFGNFELVRICWGRLTDEQDKRLDLLEVASDYHQGELVAWLFRGATGFEKELFVGIAIRRRLADALLAMTTDGFKPWWAVAVAAGWIPTEQMPFRAAPDGFGADGGWWTNARG
jgi:hypothetical protein